MNKLSAELKFGIPASIFIYISVNLLRDNNIYFILLNSILLISTIVFVLKTKVKNEKTSFIIILTLPLMPILSYSPTSKIVYYYVFIVILLLLAAHKLSKYKYLFTLVASIVLFLGSLVSNNLITETFSVNTERFIWSVPETNQAITDYQRSSFYTIYRLRLFIYNKGIYFYSVLTSIAGLFSLRNLYDTILLANIYPLALGISTAVKNHHKFINKAMLLGIAVTLFAAGIARSPDKFSAFFPAVPILIYLVILGFQNTNRFIYILLFILSLVLATSPV